MGDLVVKRGDTILDIFRFTRVDADGVKYYLLPDGKELSFNEVTRIFLSLPVKGGLAYEEVDTTFGVSICDYIAELEKFGQLQPMQLAEVLAGWQTLIKSGDPYMLNLIGGSTINWRAKEAGEKFITNALKVYVPPVQAPEDFLKSFYPSGAMIDANVNPGGWEDMLLDAALSYARFKLGKPNMTANDLAFEKTGLGSQLLDLIVDWTHPKSTIASMEKSIQSYPLVSDFYSSMKQFVTMPTPPAIPAVIGEEDELKASNTATIEDFIRSQEILYGAEGRARAYQYLNMFYNQFEFARTDWGEQTIAGITSDKFPNIFTYADAFTAWKDKLREPALAEEDKESFLQRMRNLYNAVLGPQQGATLYLKALAQAASLDLTTVEGRSDFLSRFSPEDMLAKEKGGGGALTPEQEQENFLTRMQNLYTSKYGNLGASLFAMAMQQASGLDLTTEGGRSDFYTRFAPEDVLASLVPNDVASIWQLLGLSPEQAFSAGLVGTDRDQTMVNLRQNALSLANQALQSGKLSYGAAESLRDYANQMIPFIPQTGSSKLFLTETQAREDYRKWLLGNLPEEPYRTNAWEFFPQILGQYEQKTGRLAPESTNQFADYLSGLGETFFARLSPRTDIEGQEKMVRPPGGGRLPMR